MKEQIQLDSKLVENGNMGPQEQHSFQEKPPQKRLMAVHSRLALQVPQLDLACEVVAD